MYMDSFIYIYEGVCTGSITKVRSNTAMETIVQQLLSNRAKRPGNATEQSVPLLGSKVGGSAVVEMEKNFMEGLVPPVVVSDPQNQCPLPSASSESVTQPLSQTPSTSKKIPSLLDQQIKRPRKRHFGSEDEEENVSSIWRPQARFSPFLVVEQLPGVQISKTAPCSSLSELSVFKIATELKNHKICSIDDAQKHGNTLLVKVGSASDSNRLLQCVEFCGLL